MAASRRKRRTKAELEAARKRREAARKYRLSSRHRMTVEQYDKIKEYQGGVCYICRRAKGLRRELAVDHDHVVARERCSHPHDESCEHCWRGLLCSTCNSMLAHAGDDVVFFCRAVLYLQSPPVWTMQIDREGAGESRGGPESVQSEPVVSSEVSLPRRSSGQRKRAS